MLRGSLLRLCDGVAGISVVGSSPGGSPAAESRALGRRGGVFLSRPAESPLGRAVAARTGAGQAVGEAQQAAPSRLGGSTCQFGAL